MAASLCLKGFGSSSLALHSGSQALRLRTQDASFTAQPIRRRQGGACVRAKARSDNERSARARAGLTGLLLPSVAALVVGGTSFVPEAQAEMTQAEYYKSLMESIKKTTESPPAVLSAPAIQGPLVAAAQAASPTANTEIDFGSLFSSAFTDTKPKKEEATQGANEDQPKPPSAAELRIKRAEEVAQKQREAEERRAAEQKAAQEAKAQAEARVKEAKEKAEKEVEQKRKEAADRLKRAPPAKEVAAAATKKKGHGYLPLFITQFLFLALYAGAITLAFFLPASEAEKLQARVNELFEKVSPLLEQAKPFADKAVTGGSKLLKQAQPYASKAAQQAVPLAKQAVDAAKPLAQEAQQKVGTAFQKFRAEQKV